MQLTKTPTFGADLSIFDERYNNDLDDSDLYSSVDESSTNVDESQDLPLCSYNPCILPHLKVAECGNPKCTSVSLEKYLHHACQISYMDTYDLECEGCKNWC